MPDESWSIELTTPPGITVEAALVLAREQDPLCWVEEFNVVGYAIWGKEVLSDYELKDGDRLELLRPLTIQPAEARRNRANH